MRYLVSLFLAASLVAANASAQTEDASLPKTPIQFAHIQTQPGGDLLVHVAAWIPEQRTRVVNVEVPYTELVQQQENGEVKTVEVMRTRMEQRQETYTVMRSVPQMMTVKKGDFSLYRMDGGKLSTSSLAGQTAIVLYPNQKLDTWYRSVVRPGTAVVMIRTVGNDPPPAEAPYGTPPAPSS